MKTLSLTLLLHFILAADACAYIDPGSGSYMLQIILAGLLAAAFGIKVFWQRICSFFGGLFAGRRKDGEKR